MSNVLTAPSMLAPLTGCTTIDATTPNGYLDKARVGNPDAGANQNTTQVTQNILSCETACANQPANIVGHGAEGDIDTGQAWHQFMSLANVPDWTPDMQALATKVTHLYLFGCSVGAGQEGAEFLFEVARCVDAPVSAPTGLIYCHADGHFSLQAGASWQTATPTYEPPPIDPPPLPLGTTAMPGASIASASYVSSKGVRAADRTALKMAQQVQLNEELKLEGEPGAKQTGELKIRLKDGGEHKLLILAHMLALDTRTGKFHATTPLFRQLAKRL